MTDLSQSVRLSHIKFQITCGRIGHIRLIEAKKAEQQTQNNFNDD